MEVKKIKVSNTPASGNAREVGRIKVGRYVRLYDLSEENPKLVFELLERPVDNPGAEGPSEEDHVTAVIDFFDRLLREGLHHGH